MMTTLKFQPIHLKTSRTTPFDIVNNQPLFTERIVRAIRPHCGPLRFSFKIISYRRRFKEEKQREIDLLVESRKLTFI